MIRSSTENEKNFLFLISESPFSGDYLYALALAKHFAGNGNTVLFCFESKTEWHTEQWEEFQPDGSESFIAINNPLIGHKKKLTSGVFYRCALPNFTMLNAHAQGWSFSGFRSKLKIIRNHPWDRIFVFQSHADSLIPAVIGILTGAKFTLIKNENFGGNRGVLRTGIWGENAHQSMPGGIRYYRNLFYTTRLLIDRIYRHFSVLAKDLIPLPQLIKTVPKSIPSSPLTVGIFLHENRFEQDIISAMIMIKAITPEVRFLVCGNAFEKIAPQSHCLLHDSIRHVGNMTEARIQATIEECHFFLQADSYGEMLTHGIPKGALIPVITSSKTVFVVHREKPAIPFQHHCFDYFPNLLYITEKQLREALLNETYHG